MLSSEQVQGDRTPLSEQAEAVEAMVTIPEEVPVHRLSLNSQVCFLLKYQKVSIWTKEFHTIKLNNKHNSTLISNRK